MPYSRDILVNETRYFLNESFKNFNIYKILEAGPGAGKFAKKSNLRICTNQENQRNKKSAKNSSSLGLIELKKK